MHKFRRNWIQIGSMVVYSVEKETGRAEMNSKTKVRTGNYSVVVSEKRRMNRRS